MAILSIRLSHKNQLRKNKKMRQPKPTHKKYIAPTVAKQNSTSYLNTSMQNRASVFLPKIKTLVLCRKNIQFCLAILVYHYLRKKSIMSYNSTNRDL